MLTATPIVIRTKATRIDGKEIQMGSAAQVQPVLVGFLASFLFWAGLVAFLFVVFGFLPYVKKIPPARFYSPMVLTSPFAIVIGMGGFSTYFVQTTAANIVMFSVMGLGWWYAYGGVHFWLKGFKVIEKSQIGKNGFSELMFTSATDDVKSLRLLLDSSASVNLQDDDGKTALMYAAMNNSFQAVDALLEAGANPLMKSSAGHTAYWFAEKQGHESVARQIRNHISKAQLP